VGAFVEGEMFVALGGLAVHRGYLSLPAVLLAAFTGSLAGDQIAFHVGRLRGARLLARWPKLRERVDRAAARTTRYQGGLMVVFRFIYGFRIALPVVWGMRGVAPLRFLAFDLLGCAVWAATITSLGYLLGSAVEQVLGELERGEAWLFGGLALAGFLLWLTRLIRARREAPPPPP
jgi:membrane protein DedA with SNARE-associated domain